MRMRVPLSNARRAATFCEIIKKSRRVQQQQQQEERHYSSRVTTSGFYPANLESKSGVTPFTFGLFFLSMG